MRSCVQRVSRASVTIDGQTVGRIGEGLLVLLGVSTDDTDDDARYMADKIAQLRIFQDDEGKMNRSVLDVGGGMLVVSQFTLYGDCRRGRRPGYTQAAEPGEAERLYEVFCAAAAGYGIRVETGRFRAMMQVESINDGPVTLLLDSTKLF